MSGMDLSGIDLTTEVVRTERLVLRPFRPSDADAVFAACQDAEIQRWVPAVPAPYTHADAEHFVGVLGPAGRTAGTDLAVAIEANGEPVGSSGVHRIGQHPLGPEIGYWSKDPAPPSPRTLGPGPCTGLGAGPGCPTGAPGGRRPQRHLASGSPPGGLQPGGRAALLPRPPGRLARDAALFCRLPED